MSLDLKGASASSRTKFVFYRYANGNDLWYVKGNPLVLIFIYHFSFLSCLYLVSSLLR